MKFSIVRSKLLEGLQKVANTVAPKQPVKILQNAMLRTKDGALEITTTNRDISERCIVECDSIGEAGGTTLNIQLLTSIVRELSEEKLSVEVDANDKATLQSGASYFKIEGLPVNDFPPIPEMKGTASFTLEQGAFREMLRKTCYAASTDESRHALAGVLLSFKDKKLTVVATDGRRLALVEHEVEFPVEAEQDIILPQKTVSELTRILGTEGSVTIQSIGTQALFTLGNTAVLTKLIDGLYPNYRQVIPGPCEERATIDREILLNSIRRVAVVTTEKSNSIQITFSANQLTLRSFTPDVGEARDTMPIKYAGKEITINFNPQYVMDPLRTIDDDEVYIEMNDGHDPAIMKCGVPFLYVMMPMRIS